MTTPCISREVGITGVIIIRFLMGCGQGVLAPCMNVLIACWFPLSEKSTAVALATTGNQVPFSKHSLFFSYLYAIVVEIYRTHKFIYPEICLDRMNSN